MDFTFFFYLWWFWSNNLGHRFEQLKRVDILIFSYLFYLLISSLNIVFFLNELYSFFIYLFSIGLSQSHNLDYGFKRLNRVDSPLITHVYVCHINSGWLKLFFYLLLPNFIIYLIGWKLKCIFVFWKKVFFPNYLDYFFNFGLFYIVINFFHLIKIKSIYLT